MHQLENSVTVRTISDTTTWFRLIGKVLLVLGCPSLSAAPQIIIKADDLRSPPTWQRFVDYIEANEMKASIGIITNSLESGSESYFTWIREQHDSGRIEFWHHGYDHKRDGAASPPWWEFKIADYDTQMFHFERGMELAKEKLGITFRTFGAPFNATDATTVQVLEENPDMRIWFYPQVTAGSSKLILPRISAVNIEQSTGVVAFAPFAANYPAYVDEEVLALQCHPAGWNENSWSEFALIVDFLKSEGATFTTPAEYFQIEEPLGWEDQANVDLYPWIWLYAHESWAYVEDHSSHGDWVYIFKQP